MRAAAQQGAKSFSTSTQVSIISNSSISLQIFESKEMIMHIVSDEIHYLLSVKYAK